MPDRDPHAFSVCMGMDALRICIGRKPINFTHAEVMRWLRHMSEANPSPSKDNMT